MVHRQSQVKNFRDFFLRANKYPCLSLGTSDATQDKKIILVEVQYASIVKAIVVAVNVRKMVKCLVGVKCAFVYWSSSSHGHILNGF